ncbi:MAG: nucleotidyl transferase AbiEii/AbiGii toxin family protein [Promethearchaeota archaeon]
MAFFNSELSDKFLGDKLFFEKDFILKKIEERRGLVQDLYERALNGLEYLSQLRDMGLDPIFKGGSAVQLLIPESLQRLSIDIDLAIDSSEQELSSILEQIHNKFNKKVYNFERVGTDLPPYLVLYNLYIPSWFSDTPSKIELDFLLHMPNYKTQQTPIKTFLYESDYKVQTPTINTLLGDKLTTLGPNTIGKPINEKPLSIGKQLYDISVLFNYSDNFNDLYLTFEDAIKDLIHICKIFSLSQHCPEWVKDEEIKDKAKFLKGGINSLMPYTSSELKLTPLKARTISAKISFLARLFLFKENKSLKETISMNIFQQDNLEVKNLIEDAAKIDEMTMKLRKIEIRERYHLQPKELKKIDPIALVFWFGHYFPKELLLLINS